MLGLFAFATVVTAEAESKLSHMTTLYEQICLKAFPNDQSVEALMVSMKARPLTSEEVKVTMGDDPARGWELADQSGTVWLEFPPYHACSVRWNAPEIGDLHQYRSIADRYERETGKFLPMEPYDNDAGDIHVHAVGEQRQLLNGGWESLFIFDQHITDQKRRDARETGVSLRFVHQFTDPGAK